MNGIRVLLADDHAIVRAGLRSILEAEGDIQIVGEAQDGLEISGLVATLGPNVVLMDISMPGLGGLEALRQIRDAYPNVAVVMLTIHENEQYFFQALKGGASGYVPKSAPASEVVSALRCAAKGEAYLHPSVARFLLEEYSRRGKGEELSDPIDTLTQREREVFQLVAQGLTNREIADRLCLSVNTVHNHRTSLMEKLGLHNRLDVLRYAIRHGLVTEDS